MKTCPAYLFGTAIVILICGGCSRGPQEANVNAKNLLEARSGFKTTLATKQADAEPMPVPADGSFVAVQYQSEPGSMNALLSTPADPTQKYPVMIWITGGFPASGIGESAWMPPDPTNDQSAQSYRKAGMLMMYPALRGCSGSAGFQEGFMGEVKDVIAAAEYLKTLDYVDADRIYLGGHSTGGTLVLLVAEATDMFRGVISFGPVSDPYYYYEDLHEPGPALETELRAPVHFMHMIRTPTVVVEGGSQGNAVELPVLQGAAPDNKNLSFATIPGKDHFSVLWPVNEVLAKKIMQAPDAKLTLTAAEVR